MNENHKAMAIPVTEIDGELKFLIVHDKRFREWTFVTGGCRHREIYNPIRTALRELEEETRGVVALRSGTYKYFRFNAVFEPYEKAIYHAFIFHVQLDTDSVVEKFNEEKTKMDNNQVYFRKNYDENDSLMFSSIQDIRNCDSTWKFIIEKILDNRDFYEALYKQDSRAFNTP
jgi:ADP-ribose pyrophosphatase YjhB (NUDIX family)